MAMQRYSWLCVGIILSLFLMSSEFRRARAQPTEEGDREVRVAAEGYSANVESFRFFNCQFQMADFQVGSEENAVKGDYVARTSPVIYGTWVRDGTKERYKLGCDPKTWQDALQGMKIGRGKDSAHGIGGMLPCITANLVGNGQYKFTASDVVKAATLYKSGKGPEPHGSDLGNPLFLGHMNPPLDPGHNLSEGLISSRAYSHFDGVQDVNGRKAMVFSTGDSKDKIRNIYSLDPQRGFLPLRNDVFEQSGAKTTISFITDIRACSNGRWFPERALTILNLGGGDKGFLVVREYKLVYLDADKEPREADFAMQLPKGYQINAGDNNWALYTVSEEQSIKPADLSGIANKLEESEVHWKQVAAEMERPSNKHSWKRIIVFTSLGTLLAILAALLYKWGYRRDAKGAS